MVGRANTSTSIPDVVLRLQDSKNASKSLVAPERSRATKQTWSRSNTSNDVPQLRRQSLRRPDTSRRPGRGPLQQSTLEPTTLAHLRLIPRIVQSVRGAAVRTAQGTERPQVGGHQRDRKYQPPHVAHGRSCPITSVLQLPRSIGQQRARRWRTTAQVVEYFDDTRVFALGSLPRSPREESGLGNISAPPAP